MAAATLPEGPRRGLPLAWLAAVLAAHLLLLAWPLPSPSVPPPLAAPPALQTRQVTLPVAAPAPPRKPATPPPVRRPPRPAVPAPASAAPAAPAPASAQAAAEPAPVAAPPPQEAPPVVAEAPAPAEPPAPQPAAPEIPAPQLPPTTQLSYAVVATRGGARYEATSVLNWEIEGDRYRLRLLWRAFIFSREQSSTGRLAADGLHPERFAERTRSERAAHFDEAGGRVRFSANTPDAPLLPGTQDRLSLFLQLAGRFNAQPEAFPVGTAIRLPVAGSRDLEEWVFTVEGREMLELPVGTEHVVRLQRLPRREFDQKVEVWLAPARGHLPVRMRITEANGDIADQQLSGG